MTKPDTNPPASNLSWKVWPVYAALVAIGVPWYWPAGDDRLIFGVPAWVVTALVACLVASFFTAVLLHRDWQEPAAEPTADDESEAP